MKTAATVREEKARRDQMKAEAESEYFDHLKETYNKQKHIKEMQAALNQKML